MKSKSTKKDRIKHIIIVVVPLIIIALVMTFLLRPVGEINEGLFKINEVVVGNTIDITDFILGNEIDSEKLDLSLTLNSNVQINIGDLSKTANITKIYLSNVKSSVGNDILNFYTNDIKLRQNVDETIEYELEMIQDENTSKVQFNMLFENIKQNLDLSLDTLEDGLVNGLDVDIYKSNDIQIYFDLNIVDSNGKVLVSNMKFNVDLTKLTENNYSIDILNADKYIFKYE